MGRRGPTPTPTSVLKLRGSPLATQKRLDREPKPPAGKPEPPTWLDSDARAAWDCIVPMLEKTGVLTRIDGNALARYCHFWSRWRKAEQFIAERGEMYPLKDEAGNVRYVQAWPQVAIANKLAQQLLRLEQEFGLTPAARTRIQVSGNEQRPMDPEKARYFGEG
jgi:P27 family predicted phage terminase small subunit